MADLTLENVNMMLAALDGGIGMDIIEEETDCKILHKVPSVLRKINKCVEMPMKINSADFAIMYGELRKTEREYRTKKVMYSKGQTKITEAWGWD